MTASANSNTMSFPTGTSTPTIDISPQELRKESAFLGLLDSEVRACARKDYLNAWEVAEVEAILQFEFPHTPSTQLQEVATRVAGLHGAILKAHDDISAFELEPEFAMPELAYDLHDEHNQEVVLTAYSSVLAFMQGKASEGIRHSNGSNTDWTTSIGTLKARYGGVDSSGAITLDNISNEVWGRVMQIVESGRAGAIPNVEDNSKVESGGKPPYAFIALVILTISILVASAFNKDNPIGKVFAGSGGDSGKTPATQPANHEDLPQIPGVEGGDGPDPDLPSIGGDGESGGSNPPIPAIVLTPTQDVMTIEKLALIPGVEREQMMFEATGVDFVTSDEAPHLGFEVVQGEDGTYSIDRVYNLLTGEMIEVPERVNNVGTDTFTYVDQDWQSLDQEALGHVQVFPRVDGKGVVVLRMPAHYSVSSDDPATPERDFITKRAPENINHLEHETFVGIKDALSYAMFVKGANHDAIETSAFDRDPVLYNADLTRYFYGGVPLIVGDVATQDGEHKFFLGLWLLPSGDLMLSFRDVNGISQNIVVDMINGVDADGMTLDDIVDGVRTSIGTPEFLKLRNNPSAPNILPSAPADFVP